MTETEWLQGSDLRRMLHYARAAGAGDRKLRLFAVSCCRYVEHTLTDARSREAVNVAERFAEGGAEQEELEAA